MKSLPTQGKRRVAAMATAGLLLAIGSCQPIFRAGWTVVQLLDAETNEPIIGVQVSVDALALEPSLFDAPAEARVHLAPTDATGRTWVPVVDVLPNKDPREFTLFFQRPGRTEESCTLLNYEDESGVGATAACRIHSVSFSGPPVVAPVPVAGSNPTVIHVSAYVGYICVSSPGSSLPAFVARKNGFRPRYVDELVVGVAPEGFTTLDTEHPCFDNEPPAGQGQRVTVLVEGARDYETVRVSSEDFCVDIDGTTIECSSP